MTHNAKTGEWAAGIHSKGIDMANRPKVQRYESLHKSSSHDVDVSFLSLRPGTFVHLQANEQAVEIRMDDDGKVGVCVSAGVDVATFEEIYGK